MSVQDAFMFLTESRQDPALRDRLHGLGASADLESVRQVGREAGFVFTTSDLRTAYKHDWDARWLRHRIREEGASSE